MPGSQTHYGGQAISLPPMVQSSGEYVAYLGMKTETLVGQEMQLVNKMTRVTGVNTQGVKGLFERRM